MLTTGFEHTLKLMLGLSILFVLPHLGFDELLKPWGIQLENVVNKAVSHENFENCSMQHVEPLGRSTNEIENVVF